MTIKVKDMTAEELQKLIAETVNSVVEDLMEDILGLSSESYLKSIEEARNNYKDGKTTSLEDLP
ncbi:MAG TPA: hypothetical protein VMX55_10425 [candidate division Zixibacteria bacterium]|nr:hypothetical protein [candidate division Zixibacteria bacterium]